MIYLIVTMYIQSNAKKVGSKTYRSFLLVQNYREAGKVKHKVLSNLSSLPMSLIEGIRALIKGKVFTNLKDLELKSGKNFGGLFVLRELAKELNIEKILGNSRQGKLAMLLVLGRILTQGSRRHLTFWREGEAIEEVLGLKSFDEDDLYETLDWLEKNQAKMEDQWFKLRFENEKVELFLYDVTSSYLEGEKNELAEYGYNRDGKRGKKQIVIGLLTNKNGNPIAVEVFKGNTSDVTTVPNQIKKKAERFGVSEVTFVGDRGMVKKIPTELFKEHNWHYITAITKPQIKSLIKENVFQLELFEEKLVEIIQDKNRYFLRRNPQRVLEIEKNRKDRMQKITTLCEKLNEKLKAHPKASPEIALKDLENKIHQLKLKWIMIANIKDRVLSLSMDADALQKSSQLDGCYAIKTDLSYEKINDLSYEKINAEEAHSIYKGLSEVEWAFRTMKTGLLEIRPLYHREANRTRACAFVAMLAYAITQSLWKKTAHLDRPLKTVILSLDQIQTQEIKIADQWVTILPTNFRGDQDLILKALKIQFPKTIRNTA